MINFSEIKNTGSSPKDVLINKYVQSSGLDKSIITKMFESFQLTSDGSLKTINESFQDLLAPKTPNFETFKSDLAGLAQRLGNSTNMDISEREAITNRMIIIIENFIGNNCDIATILETVCFVLTKKNEFGFAKLQDIVFGKKFNDLFESLDLSKISVNTQNPLNVNLLNAKEDKRLYESLKQILAKNNKRWGYNYHLDNTYDSIMKYIDNEIIELTNIDNVQTITDTYHMILINELLFTKDGINPMYRSLDNIKKVIPDIQTFVFDLMILTHHYINENQEVIKFISRDVYIDYIDMTKVFYSKIASSQIASKVIHPIAPNTARQFDTQDDSVYGSSDFVSIFNNFSIDYTKIDLYHYPMQTRAALECLHIIKACAPEFNLQIRSVINAYVTKAVDLVVRTEKKVIQKNYNRSLSI